MNREPSDDADLDLKVLEMLASSTGQSNSLIDGAVEEVLRELRQRLKLDVVFVAEFVEGQRVFRFVDRNADAPAVEPGAAHDLEASFCLRVVDGRLPEFIPDVVKLGPEVDLPPVPFRLGTHISTPVRLKDGTTFGTLCCFSIAPNPLVQTQDVETLRHCAKLVALKLDRALSRGLSDPSPTQMRVAAAAYSSEIWKVGRAWELSSASQRAWLES